MESTRAEEHTEHYTFPDGHILNRCWECLRFPKYATSNGYCRKLNRNVRKYQIACTEFVRPLRIKQIMSPAAGAGKE